MLEKIRYVNHQNEEIVFGADGILISGNDVRDFKWTYNSQYSRISSFSKPISNKKIPFLVYGSMAKANRLFEVFEKDVLAKKSGKLYVGDYYLQGYFIGVSKVKAVSGIVKGTLEFVTDQPSWIKEVKYLFRKGESGIKEGIDYPYTYPYDYTPNASSRDLINKAFVDSDFIITIYGNAINPVITIAGHPYQMATELKERELLTINSYEKTIIKTDSRGNKINAFAERDIENYIFKKIPTGESKITTSADFNFDIVLMAERSEPEWT